MRVPVIAIAFCAVLAVPAWAEEKPLAGSEISAFLAGATVEGVQNGTPWSQTFSADGKTVYTTAAGAQNGNWEVRGDQFCSNWPPATTWDCYGITGEGENITFVFPGAANWPAKRKAQ